MQLWGFFCNNNATFNNAIYRYGGERERKYSKMFTIKLREFIVKYIISTGSMDQNH